MSIEDLSAPSNWLAERSKVNRMMQELYAALHQHSNKAVLDATTAAFTTADKSKLDASAQTDANGKLVTSAIPDAVLSGLQWQSVWDVATNTPAIPAAAAGNNRHFYQASTAGTSTITGTSVAWQPGDWLISKGNAWERVPRTLPLINDLTTGGTSSALTAEQGKALKALVDAKPSVGSTVPSANGTASAGASSAAARADHVHPAPDLNLLKVSTYTSSGTLALDAKTKYIVIEAVGGGGGGSSARSTISDGACAGGGGGAGGYVKAWALASAMTTKSLTISVGAGGAGGSSSALNAGADGTDTTITVDSAVRVTATKGSGSGTVNGPTVGTSVTSAGGGGSAQALPSVSSPFTLIQASRGQNGQDGLAFGGANKFVWCGDGGQSILGWGGRAGTLAGSAAAGRAGGSVNRDPTLGGGGGGAGAIGISQEAGGNGAAGVVIVYEYT